MAQTCYIQAAVRQRYAKGESIDTLIRFVKNARDCSMRKARAEVEQICYEWHMETYAAKETVTQKRNTRGSPWARCETLLCYKNRE